MEIEYDKKADALYIAFRKGRFAKNKKIDDFTILDMDGKGNVLGIEILQASKRLSKKEVSEVRVKNISLATA